MTTTMPAAGTAAGRTAYSPGSRAALPDAAGVVVREGVELAWERFGTTGPHVVLLPTWSIVPSRVWRAQTAFLGRHFRVTTFDGRGSGASGHPAEAAAYSDEEYAADTLAVLDATGVPGAVLVGLSCGVSWAVRVAAMRPDRVHGIVAIAASCGLDVAQPHRETHAWDGPPAPDPDGWAMYNKAFWLESGPQGYDRFLEFFFGRMFSEPHSTKQIEDCLVWGRETGPEVLAAVTAGRLGCDGAVCTPLEPLCRDLRCPVLVVHGTQDAVRTSAIGERLAELTGGELLLVEGGGHGLPARDPVLVNHEIKAFAEKVSGPPSAPARRTWARGLDRPKRALFLSSPIGLGHARRDAAIAAELRALHPGLQVDWLAQDPVSRFLEHRGERVHPASASLASESRHVESECADHDLDAFAAIRRMDEILVANFMLFDEVAASGYDLVVGDEAWEVDHFLHENPGLKRAPFVWLTDFVGWLPMPDGGERQSLLTADYNAEMLEHRARFPALRDRSVFVGDPQDVVPASFGPGLPQIAEWTRSQFDFAGYVSGLTPVGDDERAALRERLGYRDDEPVCVVSVGGSAVGLPLLRRVADAVPAMRRAVDGLRVVLVTGPRIDPDAIPARPGLEVHGFLPDLHQHLAACDVAVVQGGLSTTMELTANRRPFVYVPLRNHFEQNIHVRHRLDRYGAGHCLDYAQACDPDALAAQVARALTTPVTSRPVATDGAAKVAGWLADLL
ncbi:alpha/beta fold hydrolase [Kineosporia sp. A_224]|uniref:alpha/beta fold hydrolase n=1 Tax=Kineosporia sp. A_224 TaxID=1962180 RepID=UPI0018E9FCA1|nr:alpha/beta fold hydrolase [Kineosporia sp. A_224]